MGRLHDDLWELASEELGPPIFDGLKIDHLRQPRYEEIEDSDEVLIFEVVRHESADQHPFNSGPGAFMYIERRRYRYCGGEEITMDVIGDRKLEINENAFLIREVEDTMETWWGDNGTTTEEIRAKLASVDYGVQRELYEENDMDFESFLDKLAQELHKRQSWEQ
jgi:hypothetical protein